MEAKISIIVPVYKVMPWIRRCIDSLLRQSYQNLEIILIDDGSPDECGKICDEYAGISPLVRVIHQENKGLSAARNAGIQIATGEWLSFVDSDDWVEKDFIEFLYNSADMTHSEIAICGYRHIYERDNHIRRIFRTKCQNVVLNRYEAVEALLYQTTFDTLTWNKLYRRELFDEVRFPNGRLYEDVATIYQIFWKANRVVFSSAEKYNYLQRAESILNVPFNMQKLDHIQFSLEIFDFFRKEYPNLCKAARSKVISACGCIYLDIVKSCGEEFSDLKREIHATVKQYRKEVWKDRKVKQKVRIFAVLSYFPFSGFDFFIKQLRRFSI